MARGRGREGGRGRGEGFTQPSPERKIHVEKHAARRCADKPRSTLPLSVSFFLRGGREGGGRERERASEFFLCRGFASWKRNYLETNLFRSAPPIRRC